MKHVKLMRVASFLLRPPPRRPPGFRMREEFRFRKCLRDVLRAAPEEFLFRRARLVFLLPVWHVPPLLGLAAFGASGIPMVWNTHPLSFVPVFQWDIVCADISGNILA